MPNLSFTHTAHVAYSNLHSIMMLRASVKSSFDLDRRQLQSAIETGSFEITEMFDQSTIKKSPLVVRFSNLGLSANIVALKLKCASKSNPNP
jgi:hypothetical protein